MRPDSSARDDAIRKALLDYHRSPGKYALSRRQPSLLYVAIKDVLQLASGRSPQGAEAAPPSPAVRQAACFFIRSTMFHPDADHYALLGLAHDAGPRDIKDRYRMMMRLTHPDFASDATVPAWPQDAATRVNRAYEILSSPVERQAYDDTLAPFPATKPAALDAQASPGRPEPERGHVPHRRTADDNRRDLRRLSTVFGAAGGAALVVAAFVNLQPDRESLVQRAAATVRRAASSEVREPALELAASPAASQAPVPGTLPVTAPATPVAAVPLPLPAIDVTPAPARTPAASAALVERDDAAPAALAPQAAPYSGPTLAEVHPLLSRLLQEIESGRGDRMIGLVERDARNAPAAQALLQHYNQLVDGARPVKVSNVQFNAQPQGGRLLVTGHLTMQARGEGAAPRDFALQAEFASREGGVVMTRLVRATD